MRSRKCEGSIGGDEGGSSMVVFLSSGIVVFSSSSMVVRVEGMEEWVQNAIRPVYKEGIGKGGKEGVGAVWKELRGDMRRVRAMI